MSTFAGRVGYRLPPTEDQKRRVINMAEMQFSDAEIAERLALTIGQVEYVRHGAGIYRSKSGALEVGAVAALRPRHARGEVASEEWWASCDRAFSRAVNAALASGGW